jgi:hypothetical protein
MYRIILLFFIGLNAIAQDVQWQILNTEIKANIKKIDFSQNYIWILTDRIYKSGDSGINWEVVSSSGIKGFDFYDDNIGWAVTGLGNPHRPIFVKTENAGSFWEIDSFWIDYLIDVSIQNESTICILGMNLDYNPPWSYNNYRNHIYRSVNNGKNWEQLYVAYGPTTKKLYFYDEKFAWVISAEGVASSIDSGKTWQSSVKKSFVNSVFFIDDKVGWLCGGSQREGYILKTVDGGKNWVNSELDSVNILNDIFFIDDYIGWACGNGGTLIYSNDGGVNWIKKHSPTNESLLTINFRDSLSGWIGGLGGTILTTDSVTLTSIKHVNYSNSIPESNLIIENYPNPFNPETFIKIHLNKPDIVSLIIYDSRGRLIKKLIDSEKITGTHKLNFTPIKLASGIYYYHIIAGNNSKVGKMIYLK